jgi:hypothetical protein
MASNHSIPLVTLFSASVSGTTPIPTSPLQSANIRSAAFSIQYPSTVQATFQLMGSLDGVTYFDLGVVIQPATGTAGVSGWADQVHVPFVAIQITPSTGSGMVTVKGLSTGG